MRIIFLGLLLANLFYFGWASWLAPPPQAPAENSIARLPRLMLTSETDARAAAVPGAQSNTQAANAFPKGTTHCVSVGPFADLTRAASAAALLQERGFTSLRQRAEAAETSNGTPASRRPSAVYWVDLDLGSAQSNTVPTEGLLAPGETGARLEIRVCPSAHE